ncbi:MAG: hypothetical protein NZ108_10455, partial [Bacteroidia bacterium]|nr:hypothetical protein [Bacteroidia bacterium]
MEQLKDIIIGEDLIHLRSEIDAVTAHSKQQHLELLQHLRQKEETMLQNLRATEALLLERIQTLQNHFEDEYNKVRKSHVAKEKLAML